MTTNCKAKLGKIDKQQRENNYLQVHIGQGKNTFRVVKNKL